MIAIYYTKWLSFIILAFNMLKTICCYKTNKLNIKKNAYILTYCKTK